MFWGEFWDLVWNVSSNSFLPHIYASICLASDVIRQAASVSSNPKLALLAASVKLDAFTAVKAEIDKLVAEYQQQQKEMSGHATRGPKGSL